MKGILFLCVANSARSQMAEGLARALLPPSVSLWSAGSSPTSVRPEAIEVLLEMGIDISSHVSKNVSNIDPAGVDVVITLCAEEECPVFLGQAERRHWGLPDPASDDPALSSQARLERFRQVRNAIHDKLVLLKDELSSSTGDTP
jgi:arsenate reductase